MSTSYSQETRVILTGFLETLRQAEGLDPVFLAQIEDMVRRDSLSDRARVQASIHDLKERSYEPPHQVD